MSGAIAAAGVGRLVRWLDRLRRRPVAMLHVPPALLVAVPTGTRWTDRLQHLGWRGLVRWGERGPVTDREVGADCHTERCRSPQCPCFQEGSAR